MIFLYTIPLGTPIPQNQQFAINVKKIPKSSEVVYGLAKIDPLQIISRTTHGYQWLPQNSSFHVLTVIDTLDTVLI